MNISDTPVDNDAPEPVYWFITLKVGDEPTKARGGTAYSQEQAKEHAALWLRAMSDDLDT